MKRPANEGDLIIIDNNKGGYNVALVIESKAIVPDIWNGDGDKGMVVTVLSMDGEIKRIPKWCLTWCFGGYWKG